MTTLDDTTGMYQCGVCKTEYARADHLIRHVRSHTKQRPYVCYICPKGFGRQDLLKRHLATHKGTDSQAGATGLFSQSGRHGPRAHQACRACAAKKVKCTDPKPCQRCKEKRVTCDSDQGLQLSEPTSSAEGFHDTPTHQPSPMTMLDDPNDNMELHLEARTPFQGHDSDTLHEHTFISLPQPMNPLPTPANKVLQSILDSSMNLPQLGDNVGFETDPMFDDVDFSFLSGIDTLPAPAPMQQPPSPVSNPTPQASAVGAGREAYRESQVLAGWIHAAKGSCEQAQQDLILLQHVKPAGPSVAATSTPTKDVSMAVRDRILTIILRTTSREVADRIIASFPPLDVLKSLINHALIHLKDQQLISFLHFPSLDLDEQRPELLAVIVAYGSVCSPSLAVRKFGYAVQEASRTAIHQLVETEHGTLRELGITQAFYIQLYLAFYSGISRKIEMAECHSMLGMTLLRRGKKLRAEGYTPPEAFLGMPGLSLHEKWLQWAEQESRKRLAYFAMTLDAHVSVTRQINALFPYSEMDVPLPAASTLWTASSATQWLDLLMQDDTLRLTQPLSLREVLRHPGSLTAHKCIVDLKCTAAISTAGAWSLIQEYRAMHTLLPDGQGWNDFVLNCRYSELSSMLETLKADLCDSHSSNPRNWILQELISLHLNASFNDISRYSGGGTELDARNAMPYVQRWLQTPQSRQAIWHAGQIFCHVRKLDSGTVADIYVLALYHAAVILWVWSLVQQTQGNAPDKEDTKVILDGDESVEVQRYLKVCRGLPALTSQSGGLIPLDEPAMVADLAADIITDNWRREQLPFTTEEVFRIMRGLSGIARKQFDSLRK